MSKLSRNIVYNLLGQGLVLAVALVAVKFIYKNLGGDAFGIIYFALTLDAVLCRLLELGILSTTTREVAAHIGGDLAYVRRFLRTASFIYWAAAVLLAFGIYWAAPLIAEKWINLKTLQAGTAVYALRVLGIAGLLYFPLSLYSSAIQGLQRMEFNNLIDVATSALRHFGTILALSFSGGLMGVIYWYVACFILALLAYFWVCARLFSLEALFPAFSLEVAKRNFPFASRTAYASVIDMAHDNADKAIVSKLLPLVVFGYYEIVYSAASRGALVTDAVSRAAYPSFSGLFEAGDRNGLMSQYRELHDLLCYGTVPVFALIPFAAGPVFSFMLKADVARTLLWPVTLLCVGFYMHATLVVPYSVSLAVGKPGILARTSYYSLIVALPLSFLLVYFFGLVGAGLASICYHVFACAYFVPRFCNECLEFPASRWFLHVLRIGLMVAVIYGGAWAALAALNRQSIFALALGYLGATALYLTVAYSIIEEDRREKILQLLHSLKLKIVEML